MTKVFLSYARDDDEGFVARLHVDLSRCGFEVWWDRKCMPSRGLTFLHEIREAINECDRVVLVWGPHAGTSDYVVAEWQHAITNGKPVTPVLRLGDYEGLASDLRPLPTEDFRDDEEYHSHLEQLVRQLSEPVPLLGRLVGVPRLPRHLLVRPTEVRSLRDLLLADLMRPVVLTDATSVTGVQGMGGIGKSILVNLLARDVEVRRAFPDGLIWLSLGQTPDLVNIQRNLAMVFSEDPRYFEDTFQGHATLARLLEDKAVLVLCDDVWMRKHAEAFLVLGPRCRAVLTTRDKGLVSSLGGQHFQVQLPTESESLRLLAETTQVGVQDLPPEGREIVHECGRLPLAVALCGGMIKSGISWRVVLDRLREAALEYIGDRHAEPEHHRTLWAALEASVDALGKKDRDRFCALSVFVQDEGIPEDAIGTLWSQDGSLDEHACQDLLIALSERSLLRLEDSVGHGGRVTHRRVWLHDLVFDYVARVSGDNAGAHERLLDAYRIRCPAGWATGPADGYFYEWLVHHLIRAGRGSEALDLLFDFLWLEAKLDRSLSRSIERDCQLVIRSEATPLAAEHSMHLAFLRDFVAPLGSADRLATTLWGHFASATYSPLRHLLQEAQECFGRAWLRPVTASLSIAMAGLIRTIQDAGFVKSLAVGDTADGDPIVAAVVEVPGSPQAVRIWIEGNRLKDLPVEVEWWGKSHQMLEQTVTAMNLPSDLKPALLQTWRDPAGGTCCRILDLSIVATADISDRVAASLKIAEPRVADMVGLPAVGSVILLNRGNPRSIGILGNRLVLAAFHPRELPRLVRPTQTSVTIPDLDAVVDEEVLAEYKDLVILDFQHQNDADYVRRLERLAETLTAVLGEEISVQPKAILSARTMVWDVETGHLVPGLSWTIPGSSRPVLVGETFEGIPFVVLVDEMGSSIWKRGSSESHRLSWMGHADKPVFSRWRGRPAIVKGGLSGIEVVDPSTCRAVGRFEKHLDEETLLAAGLGEDGTPLVASVGRLGSRGRFSTSVRIWEIETQQQISPTGTAHTGEIKAITSGRYRGIPVFATGSGDLICIWRAAAQAGYASASEPDEILDPNICGRVPLRQLPLDYRHHDLGAVCPSPSHRITTWSAARSDAGSLEANRQEWALEPLNNDGGRFGVPSSHLDIETSSDVVSVWMSGKGDWHSSIETTRRDGTVRKWIHSYRADPERQFMDWHYWHCVSVVGALAGGQRMSVSVDPYDGSVTVDFECGHSWNKLTYDPGCPATQCALGEDGRTVVIFDERGIAHHLELMVPVHPGRTRPGPATGNSDEGVADAQAR